MTTTDLPTIHIKSPTDLLSAVPYLLGFRPSESLVLVGFDANAVTISGRTTLTDLDNPEAMAGLMRTIQRGSATGVVAIVYTDTDRFTELSAVPLGAPAAQAGLELISTIRVHDGRWRALEMGASGMRSKERSLPTSPTAIEASAVYAGLTALPNRAAIAAMFAPIPNRPALTAEVEQYWALRERIEIDRGAATWQRSSIRSLFRAARQAQAGIWPSDDDVARHGVALFALPVRDALWLAVDNDRLIGLELWVNLARRLPSSLRAAPLFLAGWRAYRDGDGATAAVAAGLALRADPMCTAADLLLTALGHGVDPCTLPRLRVVDNAEGGDQPTEA